MSPLRSAILAQAVGGLAAIALTWATVPEWLALPLALAGLQGALAALTGAVLGAPIWWLPIHLVFMPLVVLVGRLDVAPGWYLGGFLLLLAIFWRTDRSRVPLYLSNAATADALAGLLPATPCRVIDLGCGDGALLRRLARQRPDCRFLGIEHAPLTWLWARLAAIGLANCKIRRGDFWGQPLAGFDVVYAFLSPAPMPRLWTKAQQEMAPDTLLVSNSFAVPGIEPARTLELDDRRRTQLHCYRPAANKGPDSVPFPDIPASAAGQ